MFLLCTVIYYRTKSKADILPLITFFVNGQKHDLVVKRVKMFIKISNLGEVIYIYLSLFALSNSTFLVLEYWGLEIWGMFYFLWFSLMEPNFKLDTNIPYVSCIWKWNFYRAIWKIPLMIFFMCVWLSIYFLRYTEFYFEL